MDEFRALPKHDDGCTNVNGHHVKIGDRARVGNEASVGDRARVGNEASVGDRARVGNEARVGDRASVGNCFSIAPYTCVPFGANVKTWHDILQIGPIGSRSAMLCAARADDGGIVCATGCRGEHERFTLTDLENAVSETHGDNEYAVEYRDAIARIKQWFEV